MITSETLRIVLAVDGEQEANRALGSTEKSIGSLDGAAAAAGQTFTAFKGVAVAAAAVIGTAVVSGIGRAIKANIDYTDQVGKTAQRIGASTEALSEYAHVAKLSGIEMSTLATAWQRQTRRISEATVGTGTAVKALAELKIPIQDIKDLAPEEQFELIAAAMQELPSQADRVRLAMALWDTEGVSLVQTLANGTEGLSAMRKEARELGLSLSTEQTKQAAEFNDAVAKLGAAWDGLVTQVVLALAGPLTALIDWFTSILSYAKPVVEVFKSIKEAIFGVGEELDKIANRNVDFEQMEERLALLRRSLEGTSDRDQRSLLSAQIGTLETALGKMERPAKKATDALNDLSGRGGGVGAGAGAGGAGGLDGASDALKDFTNELDEFGRGALTFATAKLDDTTVAVARQGDELREVVIQTKEATKATQAFTEAQLDSGRAAKGAAESIAGLFAGLGISFDVGGATISTGIFGQLMPLLQGGLAGVTALGPLGAAGLGAGLGGGLFGGSAGAIGGAAAGGYGGYQLGMAAGAPLMSQGFSPFLGPIFGTLLGAVGGGFLGGKLFGDDKENPRLYVQTLEAGGIDVRGSRGNLGSRGTFAQSPFGNVVVGGLDGQGRPSGDMARGIAALDQQIAELLDEDQLGRAIAAAQSHAEDTKAGSFDIGTTTVQRADEIFSAIGGDLEKLYLALDPTAESIEAVISALAPLQEMGDNARTVATSWDAADEAFLSGIASLEAITQYMNMDDPLGEIGKSLDDLSRGPLERMTAAAAEVTELAAAYDGSILATREMASAVADLAAAEVQALAAIRNARTSVGDTTENSLRSIDKMGLSGSALFDFEISRANELKNLLPTLTDPDAIASTVREINALGISALSAIGPGSSGFERKRGQVRGLIEGTGEFATDQLTKKEQLIVDAHETAAQESKDALGSAATDLQSAAAELKGAATRIQRPPNVTVYVSGDGEVNG